MNCGTRLKAAKSCRHPCDYSESRSSSGPLAAHGPPAGPASGDAEMCMRRRVTPAARSRPVVPVGTTAGSAASYSAVQLRRGPRKARGRLRRFAEHAAQCRSCGVADGAVHQVGPSGTAHGSSQLVKAHTPCRSRPSCRNSADLASPPDGSLPAICGEQQSSKHLSLIPLSNPLHGFTINCSRLRSAGQHRRTGSGMRGGGGTASSAAPAVRLWVRQRHHPMFPTKTAIRHEKT